MVYEATASEANAVHGTPYADAVKGYLKDSSCATKPSNTSIRSAPTFPVSSVASMTNPSSAIVSTQSISISSANSSSGRKSMPSIKFMSTATFNSSSSHTSTAYVSLTHVSRPTGGLSNNLTVAPIGHNGTVKQGPTVSRSKITGISGYSSQKTASTSTAYNISSFATSKSIPTATSSILAGSISSYLPSSQDTASTSTASNVSSFFTSKSTPIAISSIFTGSISSYSPSPGVPLKLNNHSSTSVYQYPSIRTSVVSGIPSVGSSQTSIHTSFISDTISTTQNSHTTDSPSIRSPISSFSSTAEVVRSSVIPSVSYATVTEETFTTKM